MTSHDELAVVMFSIGGVVFLCAGLLGVKVQIKGSKPYQQTLFRLLLIAVGINLIIVAYHAYRGF